MTIINALYCISVPPSSDYKVRETLKFKLITKIEMRKRLVSI